MERIKGKIEKVQRGTSVNYYQYYKVYVFFHTFFYTFGKVTDHVKLKYIEDRESCATLSLRSIFR